MPSPKFMQTGEKNRDNSFLLHYRGKDRKMQPSVIPKKEEVI